MAFEPQGHLSHCQALLLELDDYHMGVGAFPFLRVNRRDTGTGVWYKGVGGASHRRALHIIAHRVYVQCQWAHVHVCVHVGVGTADPGLSLPDKAIELQGHFDHH